MSFPFVPRVRQHGCGDPGQEIPFACMFDGAQYLTRTPPVAGNQHTFTLSRWIKMSAAVDVPLLVAGVSSSYYTYLTLKGATGPYTHTSPDNITSKSTGTAARAMRDYDKYRHVHWVFDATQAVAADRVRCRIDGVPVAMTWSVVPSLNETYQVNRATPHFLGSNIGGVSPGKFYAAEDVFLDGIAAEAEAFGYFNRFGVWVPRRFAGLGQGVAAYGAQGSHLDYADPLNLGNDVSGNGNHWTPSGLTAANQVMDTPTHGFPTYSPLNINSTMALSDGNLTALKTSSSGSAQATQLLPVTGKWYWEGKLINGYDNYIGIAKVLPAVGSYMGGDANGYAYRSFAGAGQKMHNGVNTAYGAAAASGDVVGVCFDADAGTIRFSIKGTLYEVAYSGLTGRFFPAVSSQWTNTGTGWTLNFGQRPFAYTPPNGYKSLSTLNLPCPAIKRPDDYFTIRLRTSGAGVADLPWNPTAIKTLVISKLRDATTGWRINDTLRPGRAWASELATADFADPDGLTLTSTGYSIGGGSGLYRVSGGLLLPRLPCRRVRHAADQPRQRRRRRGAARGRRGDRLCLGGAGGRRRHAPRLPSLAWCRAVPSTQRRCRRRHGCGVVRVVAGRPDPWREPADRAIRPLSVARGFRLLGFRCLRRQQLGRWGLLPHRLLAASGDHQDFAGGQPALCPGRRSRAREPDHGRASVRHQRRREHHHHRQRGL